MSDSILHPNTDRLQSFVEGNLSEADHAVVESHIMVCARCQKEVQDWRSLFSMLASLPQFSPSANFTNRVMASVRLPDPWYIRALAWVADRLTAVAPRTTRGWALAAACLALPSAALIAAAVWLISQPFLTPANVLAFGVTRAQQLTAALAQGALARLLQSDVALIAARALAAINEGGVGTAGALLAAIAVATAASAYILYQNLFRTNSRRNRSYVSYSF